MSAVIEFHFEETHEYNHISEKYENINKNLDLELPNKYLIKIIVTDLLQIGRETHL